VDHIQIVEYSAAHRQEVIDMVLGIQREEFGLPITIKDQPDLEDIERFFLKQGNFWVATEDGRVVGTVGAFDLGGGNAVLRKMFVKKEHRGKGVSKALLNVLLEWAKRSSFRRVYLGTTPKYLAAHRFYEKNGFVEITKEDLPAGFPVMEVDKKFYRYDVW
jgi:GNAT superfamily N-acetyltransferase